MNSDSGCGRAIPVVAMRRAARIVFVAVWAVASFVPGATAVASEPGGVASPVFEWSRAVSWRYDGSNVGTTKARAVLSAVSVRNWGYDRRVESLRSAEATNSALWKRPFERGLAFCPRGANVLDDGARVTHGLPGDVIEGAGDVVRSNGRRSLPVRQQVCFVAGTLVHTSDGQKPIEEIRVGDEVLSYNEETGETEYKPVLATFSHEAKEVLDVSIEGDTEPVGVTPEHPFFVRRARDNTDDGDSDKGENAGRWIAAGKLREGDRVRRPNGEWVRAVRIEKRATGEKVYNFSVAENHTYFVGRVGALVHNDCIELVDPGSVNFSQRSIGEEVFDYADDMLNGRWDWSRSGPLRVTEVNGRLISYDNRRLAAAQLAGLREVPIVRVNLDDLIPVPSARKTWRQAFDQRRRDPRNVRAGGVVPPEGLPELPDIAPPRMGR